MALAARAEAVTPGATAIRRLLVVAAVPLLLVVAVASSAPVASAQGTGFVTRNGTQLELDGQPWGLFGASTYGTSNPGGQQSIAAEISLATSAGLNTLRIVDMFDASGVDPDAPYDEAAWSHVDELLAEMSDAGLHAILDLSAFRNHLQNRELYVKGGAAVATSYPTPAECIGKSGAELDRCVGARWCIENAASCTNPYSTDVAAAWDSFLAFVATRVNTVTGVQYRADPTIAIVSFAGEPNPPNSSEPLKPATQELTDFYARVFDEWKSHDLNHLVTTGGLLHIDWEELFGGSSGIDHEAIFALPSQDVLSIHNYFGRFPATAANDTKTAIVAAAAETEDKPWINEEFGFPQEPVDPSTSTTYTEADRGDWFRNVFEISRAPPEGVPAAGVAFWNLGPEVAAGSHDVNPNTPATWAAVRAFRPVPQPTWQTPVTLSTSAQEPTIGIDADGAATVLARTGTFPDWRDLTWTHSPGGQWPSAGAPVTPPTVNVPLLTVADGGAIAVWVNGSLLQASYRSVGEVWGPTETIATTGPYDPPTVAIDAAGNVAVAWARSTSGTKLVEVALRSVSSGWLPVTTFPSGSGYVDWHQDVAFDGTGTVVLAWESIAPLPYPVRVLAATGSGAGSWSAPFELTPLSSSAPQKLSVSGNGAGTAVVTWHDVTTVRAAVRQVGIWGPNEVLATGTSSLMEIDRAAVDAGGNITSLWARHDGGAWKVEAASRPAGGSWQLPATTLSSTPNGGVEPVLAGNGAGDQVATWRQTDGAHVRIAAAIRPAGAAWPASPELISSPSANAELARVVIDDTGLAAAVWLEGGNPGVARAAFSDGVAPMATITTPPEAATYAQGQTVMADYACADDVPGQLASCAGSVPDGDPIPTTAGGPASFAVTATDRAGNSTTTTHAYTVAAAPAPEITGVDEASNSVPRFGRFEAEIELSESYANPFDPAEIAVDVTFTSPSGRDQVVPAFWYEPFTAIGSDYETYTSAGAPGWRVRFAPDEVGTYAYSVAAVAGAVAATPVDGSFEALGSGLKGFVRTDDRNGRNLRFDNGDPYVPIGHNLAFEDGNPALNGVDYYDSLLPSFARAGENWSRIWMTDFNRSALEWGEGHYSQMYAGPGVYSLPSAWRLDRILELAEQNGVRMQVVLSDHGQFSNKGDDRWPTRCAPEDVPPCEPGDAGYDPGNAYNEVNGGPVPAARPDLFFSNAEARELMKKRLRYVIARWGAFGSVLAWELFNEVQFVGTTSDDPFTSPQLRDDIVDWHADMSQYLKSNDPFGHLVTTSSAIRDTGAISELNAIWELPAIDVVQIHWYEQQPELMTTGLADMIADFTEQYDKPVIVGELGLPRPAPNIPNPEPGFDPTTFAGGAADRDHLSQGTHLHNAMWTAAVSGSGAAYWWWGNYIAADTDRHRGTPTFPLNEHVAPALVAYLEGEDWAPLDLQRVEPQTSGPIVAVGSASNERGFLWVRDALNEYGSGSPPGDIVARNVTGATIGIPGMADGAYEITVYDTWDAEADVATLTAIASGGTLDVQLPQFTRDIALKLTFAGSLLPPVASFTVNPVSGLPPLTVLTDALLSSDPNGSLAGLDYDWDWGDGSPADQGVSNPSHEYTDPGSYQITLTVTNEWGLSDSATQTVTVDEPLPPVASFTADPVSGAAPLEVTVDGTGSFEPNPGSSIGSYEWDWGDGSPTDCCAVITPVIHTYAVPGSYEITLTVTNDFGLTDTATQTVTVERPPNLLPFAGLEDAGTAETTISGEAPLEAQFQLRCSDNGDYPFQGIVGYTLDFGDGSPVLSEDFDPPVSTPIVEYPDHTYADPGSYTAVLSCTDTDAATATAEVEIEVTSPVPTPITVDPPAPPETGLWAWGYNDDGQLGDGTTDDRLTPTRVGGLTGVDEIATSWNNSLALVDGEVWRWGHGLPSDQLTPVKVSGLTGVDAIAAGHDYGFALVGGEVWRFEMWSGGGLGKLNGLAGLDAIAAGNGHQLALIDGEVWAWGYGGKGQLGTGTAVSVSYDPVRVGGLTGVDAIEASGNSSYALVDGEVWAWGDNWAGQIGDGTQTSQLFPLKVTNLPAVDAIAAGGHHALALVNDEVWAWGYNGFGQLGTGTTTPGYQTTPVRAAQVTLSGIDAIAASSYTSYALVDGEVWGWGYGSYGALGNGRAQVSYAPVKVGGLTGVEAIAAGRLHVLTSGTASPTIGVVSGSAVAPAGGTVTSDVDGGGVTPDDPLEVAVMTPNGGPVSIVIRPAYEYAAPGSGFFFYGFERAIEIAAPAGTVESPLVLTFTIDGPYYYGGYGELYRDGAVVSSSCTDPNAANPDPCIASRTSLANGDEEIVVHTSHASEWAFVIRGLTVDAGSPYTAPEGSSITLSGSASAGTGPYSFLWDIVSGLDDPTIAAPSFSALDDGVFPLRLTAIDALGLPGEDTSEVTVTNADPVVGSLSLPATVAPGTPVALSAAFSDAGVVDTHEASIDWGDDTVQAATVSESNGAGMAAGSHTYATPGNRTVTVKVTDDDGGQAVAVRQIAVAAPNPCAGPAPPGAIVRGTGNDTINGTPGNDVIFDAGGKNTINGRGGNDTICTGPGNDTIDAGDGNDIVNDAGGTNTVAGGAGNDSVVTASGNDTIDLGGGNDSVFDDGGTNKLVGASGDDALSSGPGNDTIDAGDGNDTVLAGGGTNKVTGAGGNDVISTGSGNDTIDAGAGTDTVTDTGGTNTVNGAGGVDRITTGSGNDTIDGGAEQDTIDAGGGNNLVNGSGGDDAITTGVGNDTIDGGADKDTIDAGAGSNVVNGSGGDDRITTGAGSDRIDGGAGNDTIGAGDGANDVKGSGGDDQITTGAGNDTIDGGSGFDTCSPGGGVNTVRNCEG